LFVCFCPPPCKPTRTGPPLFSRSHKVPGTCWFLGFVSSFLVIHVGQVYPRFLFFPSFDVGVGQGRFLAALRIVSHSFSFRVLVFPFIYLRSPSFLALRRHQTLFPFRFPAFHRCRLLLSLYWDQADVFWSLSWPPIIPVIASSLRSQLRLDFCKQSYPYTSNFPCCSSFRLGHAGWYRSSPCSGEGPD